MENGGMTWVDNIIGATGQWVSGSDPDASLGSPLQWLRRTSGYVAINRMIGLAIPFAPRNGFRVIELRPGFVKASIPLKGNKNHFGSLYAGAFFLVAEIPGGVLTILDVGPAYTPILKEMTLQFLQPANSDVVVEFALDPQAVDAIKAEADETGRAAFELQGLMYDKDGNHVATSIGHYRVRKKGFNAARN